MVNVKPIREHTILFTEKCPLACTYCNLKVDSVYGTSPDLTEEEIDEMLQGFSDEDDPEIYETRILFTGGEPFLFWPMIKRKIEKWGNRFSYNFNTSGYCLTKEILEFLSHYRVDFNLSVDGPAYITDVLRPTANPNAEPYYHRMETKVFPELLYYFPFVQWKTIITQQFHKEVFNTYLEAEKQGFKRIHFLLDFLSSDWSEQEIEELQLEFYKIITHMIARMENNEDVVMVRDLQNIIHSLLTEEKVSPDCLVCKLFNGRSLRTMNAHEEKFCMSSLGSLSEVKTMLEEELTALNGECPREPDCPFFNFCGNFCCPKNSYDDSEKFYYPRDLECIMNKIHGKAALALLTYGNDKLKDKIVYQRFLGKCLRKEW